MGFFDILKRYAGLDAKSDPRVEATWRRPPEARKFKAGRKPWDAVVVFKALVLCKLYNLSGEQFEYRVRYRLSFMRFLGLGLEDPVPDVTTVWLYREQLVQGGVVDELFGVFDAYLKGQGWLAMCGQVIDASIVPVPNQRNGRDENAAIKAGETPDDWADKPAKTRRKDTDACWTKKHGTSHYEYENHVNVDRRHKLIRRYKVSNATVNDSQVIDDVLDDDNTASGVWADSAYRLAEIEERLEERSLKSRIHRKGRRNCPLTQREQQCTKTRPKVRARLEHVFGAQANDMGGAMVRSIGITRGKARTGLKNLAYNMRCAVQPDGLAAARGPT